MSGRLRSSGHMNGHMRARLGGISRTFSLLSLLRHPAYACRDVKGRASTSHEVVDGASLPLFLDDNCWTDSSPHYFYLHL
jgi:hypothetical protein